MKKHAQLGRQRRASRLRSGSLARLVVAGSLTLALGAGAHAAVPVLQPPFDQTYTVVDLGAVPSVPAGYGALSIPPYDPTWVILVGAVDTTGAALYANQVVRDPSGHIVSFNPTTLPYATTPGANVGMSFGEAPDNVLFYSSHAVELGQVTPSRGVKVVDLADHLDYPLDGIGIVPPGYANEGRLKFIQRITARWGMLDLVPDGAGTFDVTGATLGASLSGTPLGFAYVTQGPPAFPTSSILVAESATGRVVAYETDANGDPVAATRRVVADFTVASMNPMGIAQDPIAGDFLITNYLGRVIEMRRIPGPVPTPTPVATATPIPTPTASPTPVPTATPTPTPPPTPTPTSAVAQCAPAPLVTCAVPGKATIGIYGNANDPKKSKLDWKWLKGSVSSDAFGDPIGSSANYRLCVYDDDSLRLGLAVAAGGTCDGKPCWKETRAGLKFQSSKHPNDYGVTQLALHPAVGKASIALHGKGATLPSPFPFADTTSVTVQLVKNPGAGSDCWSATFPAPAKTSGPVKLKLVDHVP